MSLYFSIVKSHYNNDRIHSIDYVRSQTVSVECVNTIGGYSVFTDEDLQPYIESLPKTVLAQFNKLRQGQDMRTHYHSRECEEYLYKLTYEEEKTLGTIANLQNELKNIRKQIADLIPKSLKDREKELSKMVKTSQGNLDHLFKKD